MSYTVKFVDNETFERLPYKDVGISLGVADRNAGVAYVRDTGNPMDVFTAYHELEHLKGDDLHEFESPGEDGVYYKKFGETVSQFFQSSIPGTRAFKNNALPAIASIIPGGSNILGAFQKGSQQSQPQQATMDQFNPAVSMTPPSPATSQVGGATAGQGGGGLGGGTINKVRDFMKQRQSGFYSGREAGGL